MDRGLSNANVSVKVLILGWRASKSTYHQCLHRRGDEMRVELVEVAERAMDRGVSTTNVSVKVLLLGNSEEASSWYHERVSASRGPLSSKDCVQRTSNSKIASESIRKQWGQIFRSHFLCCINTSPNIHAHGLQIEPESLWSLAMSCRNCWQYFAPVEFPMTQLSLIFGLLIKAWLNSMIVLLWSVAFVKLCSNIEGERLYSTTMVKTTCFHSPHGKNATEVIKCQSGMVRRSVSFRSLITYLNSVFVLIAMVISLRALPSTPCFCFWCAQQLFNCHAQNSLVSPPSFKEGNSLVTYSVFR